MGKITLYTFEGWGARIFKLLVGIPFLAGGALAIKAGMANPTVPPNPIILLIGGIAAFAGVVALSSAFENDEVSLTLGSDRNDPK